MIGKLRDLPFRPTTKNFLSWFLLNVSIWNRYSRPPSHGEFPLPLPPFARESRKMVIDRKPVNLSVFHPLFIIKWPASLRPNMVLLVVWLLCYTSLFVISCHYVKQTLSLKRNKIKFWTCIVTIFIYNQKDRFITITKMYITIVNVIVQAS